MLNDGRVDDELVGWTLRSGRRGRLGDQSFED